MLSTYGLTHPLFNYCGDHECHGHSGWLIVEPKVSNEWMMAGSYHTPNRSYPLGIFLEYSDTLPTYGIIFSNFASKNILATCEPFAGKYSRYMLRVSKLNVAEHDGVWHRSFCTCLYRAGTDASFFPQGMKIQRRHPTLHPTLHIPKLH